MKRILFVLAILNISLLGFTQQEQQYTQYMVNGYVINPARTGLEDFMDLKVGYRNQWLGLSSNVPGQTSTEKPLSPRTAYLSFNTNIGHHGTGAGRAHHGKQSNMHQGIGGYLYDDQTYPIGRSGAYLSYAVHSRLTRSLSLSVGAFMGMKRFRVYTSEFVPADQGDQLLINQNVISRMVPDASIGAFLYSKYYYLGFSSFQLLANKVSPQVVSSSQGTDARLKRHYILTGGMKMPFTHSFTMIPSFAVKMISPAPVSIDGNLLFMYTKYFMGVSCRFGSTNFDSFAGVLGTTLAEKIDISYSYDVTMSALRSYHTGSHEIIIGYRIKHPYHVDCPGRKWH